MRTALIEMLVKLAEADERMMLLTADLGWSIVEPFARVYPQRFVNVGVAEQNMLGIATGLAQVGYVPYVYSIATFSSMRCYEQLAQRSGAAAAAGAGPGDWRRLRVRPCGADAPRPGRPRSGACPAGVDRSGPGGSAPTVQRPGGVAVPAGTGLPADRQIEPAECPRSARPVRLAYAGGGAARGERAVADYGRDCPPGGCGCGDTGPGWPRARRGRVGPSQFSARTETHRALSRFPVVFAVEEAYVTGGLGSLAAEAIAEGGLRTQLVRCGVTGPSEYSGSEEYLRSQSGLTAGRLAEQVRERLYRRRLIA